MSHSLTGASAENGARFLEDHQLLVNSNEGDPMPDQRAEKYTHAHAHAHACTHTLTSTCFTYPHTFWAFGGTTTTLSAGGQRFLPLSHKSTC